MRSCEHCGTEFKPAKRSRRYCSRRCSNLGQPRGAIHEPRLVGTFYERNADRIKAQRRQQYADDPAYRQRVLARLAARRAFPERQPCVVCGEPGERHHEDYEQPLVIVWYCRRHHIERHVVLYGSWGSGLSR